jgi:NADP-dependent 3-hydroxy acid dehydrogenase YdfG
MNDRLKNSVALVTGASSGIGETTALALADQGATVALVARRQDRLRAAADRIAEGPGDALVLEGDITDQAQARRVVDDVVERFGQLDILVNCAGTASLDPVEEASVEDWQTMVHTNLLGLMYCCHAALPSLLAAAEGPHGVADLVNISSVAGRKTRVGNSVYAATKHGVGAFSESLRQEVTERHVRVGLIEPGMVTTEMTGSPAENPDSDFTWLEPVDIAEAVVFVVSRPARAAVNEVLIRPTEQQR